MKVTQCLYTMHVCAPPQVKTAKEKKGNVLIGFPPEENEDFFLSLTPSPMQSERCTAPAYTVFPMPMFVRSQTRNEGPTKGE